MAKDIAGGKHLSAKDIARAMDKIIATDKEFQAKFETATASKPTLVRYYLRALENAQNTTDLEPAKVVNLREDVVNIEHILPENPHADWQMDKDTADAYCHRIGNLTLMRKKLNSDAGNATFQKKKPFYEQEQSLSLTKELTKFRTWGPKQIEERQKRMAELAAKIWSVKV